jgi:hypothetical protein
MTTFIIAYVLPFVLIITICLWGMLRRSTADRCKRLFRKITAHPNYNALDMPKLFDAVRCEDEPYLKAYLKNMGRP